ncbi:MAG: pyridoxine 5'-phosphate synthase [Proteobacteria bacterium]|nr:pyridoxine 5'-phosphate synthase [Pseudomonadota bacterium]
MTKLSVNVNKLATLRNARGKNNPDVLEQTLAIINYGAHGITVHPRPDGRHIRHEDVYAIANSINVEFNIEGYPDKAFLTLVKEIRPAQCTLVPDPPEVLTSNAGWSIRDNYQFLRDIVTELHDSDIRTSLFIDPMSISPVDLSLLSETQTDRVELYTEAYAESFGTNNALPILKQFQQVATVVNQMGIALNAGHDLNLQNLNPFLRAIPNIQEVSIGHALICDALNFGLKETITKYLNCLKLCHSPS